MIDIFSAFRKPKKYRIEWASNPKELEQKVNNRISQGWRPQGGVTINEYMRTSTGSPRSISAFAQAMII